MQWYLRFYLDIKFFCLNLVTHIICDIHIIVLWFRSIKITVFALFAVSYLGFFSSCISTRSYLSWFPFKRISVSPQPICKSLSDKLIIYTFFNSYLLQKCIRIEDKMLRLPVWRTRNWITKNHLIDCYNRIHKYFRRQCLCWFISERWELKRLSAIYICRTECWITEHSVGWSLHPAASTDVCHRFIIRQSDIKLA